MNGTSLATIILMVTATMAATDLTRNPTFEHPVIKEHGGIVALPEASHQPKPNSSVLLDIVADEKSGGVIKGLDRAALILNQYTQAGAGMDYGLKMAIVLHGPATKAALSQEAYAEHSDPYMKDKGKTENPNLKLLAELKKAGVEIFVCGQALAHQGFAVSDVASEVEVAVSAATVTINLQMDGYAYIPFK